MRLVENIFQPIGVWSNYGWISAAIATTMLRFIQHTWEVIGYPKLPTEIKWKVFMVFQSYITFCENLILLSSLKIL